MFVSGSSPRRPALPVPARPRTLRVAPASNTPAAGEGADHPAFASADSRPRAEVDAGTPVAEAASAAGVTLQVNHPHPRRGLRADASERRRYARAYAQAQAPTPHQPRLVRSA